jgi:hypothetical protein
VARPAPESEPHRVGTADPPGDRHSPGQPEGQQQVEPEDRPPVGDRQHRRPGEGPEHRAQLLHRADHAERHRPAPGRPAIGDQGERRRHQSPGTHALQPTPQDRRTQVVRGRGEQGAQREEQQAADQHRDPAAQVGQPAQQRQGGGVAEQEAADDRRGPLQLVQAHSDPGQDVGQREDDDVGVGGGDENGEGGQDDARQPGLSWWAVR